MAEVANRLIEWKLQRWGSHSLRPLTRTAMGKRVHSFPICCIAVFTLQTHDTVGFMLLFCRCWHTQEGPQRVHTGFPSSIIPARFVALLASRFTSLDTVMLILFVLQTLAQEPPLCCTGFPTYIVRCHLLHSLQ